MKILKIVLCLLFAVQFNAQQPVEAVMKKMSNQEADWNRGDLAAFMEYYWKHDSVKFISSRGVTYGWQKVLDNYRRAFPDKPTMGTLKYTIIEATRLSDDAVCLIGKFELAREKPASGYFTLMWRKINGNWVIVWDHTS